MNIQYLMHRIAVKIPLEMIQQEIIKPTPYFETTVKYLENLSSPRSELTYMWQHLKFKDFKID